MWKKSIIGKFKHYLRAFKAEEMIRRYFILNAFDGALAVLGIVIGAYVVGVKNPSIIIGSCLGACLAMSLSGFFGAYMSERAERVKQLKDLEITLFTSLKNSFLDKAAKVTVVGVAFINGISPTLTIIVAITPFFVAYLNLVTFEEAFYCFLGLTLTLLFMLGVFLGKVSKENTVIYGLKMMTVGIIVVSILVFFHGLG
ncbi:MAG: hypothetical protein N3E48_03930 [Candidatus Bathyarchaeota archaeon]|nr:hypothetical protein [Candidatus Bathyarchaeota archaeon]